MDKKREMMIFCLLLAAISSPVFTGEWKANIVKNLDALVRSCVVVPCSFTHPKGNLPTSRLRGIWYRSNKTKEHIYHEDSMEVLENFRGRTRLLGQLGQNNCTLEIIEIKDHDNGPFCLRIETDTPTPEKFSFVDDCVELKMLSDPQEPTLNHPKTAIQGHPYTVTCSVTHTCPSHVPNLTWSRSTEREVTEVHRELHFGYWEAMSILTFIPVVDDDHSDVTCTVEFNGPLTSSKTLSLHVKRIENYNHIIIPTVVGIGTAVIFGVLCIFTIKRYKRRIIELQSRDGSMWNRLSRLSRRIHSNGPGPSRSDQRPKNVNSKYCVDQKFSKPRVPSPKSQPKSCSYKEDFDDCDDYINTADLNIYGNL